MGVGVQVGLEHDLISGQLINQSLNIRDIRKVVMLAVEQSSGQLREAKD